MPTAQENSPSLLTTTTQPALEPSLLPSVSDPTIVLEIASGAEFEQTSRLNAGEWKGFLSESSYLDREAYLGTATLTRDGGQTCWILTCSKLPVTEDGTRAILASCETVRKTAYVATKGRIEKVVSHGIASVYCRPEYRGRGYAGRMVKELGQKLENFQQLKGGSGKFSVLYSDIGKQFYAKHGWNAFPSTHINLSPIDNAGEYHQRKAEITPLPQIEDLKLQELGNLSLIQNLEESLVKMSSADQTKTYVAFRPDMPQLEWHFMREEFLAESIGYKKPDVKGAIDRRTGVALVWSRTYAGDASDWALNVQYVHVPLEVAGTEQARKALSALLLRAQYEAKEWDMQAGVEVWDPREDTISAAQAIAYGEEVQVITRDQEHVCSLKWNGPATDEVIWYANERYAWN